MAMKRIAAFWNYLPAFIAVAETEHLRLAAQQLRVSPSSLSRMVGLLEHHLGYALFTRTGRRMTLNPAGQKLQCVVRQSMRLVDDAVSTHAAQD
jgi:LysR family transcriptional activator of glutamate synthase operon